MEALLGAGEPLTSFARAVDVDPGVLGPKIMHAMFSTKAKAKSTV